MRGRRRGGGGRLRLGVLDAGDEPVPSRLLPSLQVTDGITTGYYLMGVILGSILGIKQSTIHSSLNLVNINPIASLHTYHVFMCANKFIERHENVIIVEISTAPTWSKTMHPTKNVT